jgi:hypothetical protein
MGGWGGGPDGRLGRGAREKRRWGSVDRAGAGDSGCHNVTRWAPIRQRVTFAPLSVVDVTR